jgi:hypothetical protein
MEEEAVHITMHSVDFRYTRQELLALFAYASQDDVDAGGRYDRRSGAINVWSHHWGTAATKHDSETLGTLYVQWADDNRLYRIACDTGFALADMLHELAVLEHKALGYVKHGKKRW